MLVRPVTDRYAATLYARVRSGISQADLLECGPALCRCWISESGCMPARRRGVALGPVARSDLRKSLGAARRRATRCCSPPMACTNFATARIRISAGKSWTEIWEQCRDQIRGRIARVPFRRSALLCGRRQPAERRHHRRRAEDSPARAISPRSTRAPFRAAIANGKRAHRLRGASAAVRRMKYASSG